MKHQDRMQREKTFLSLSESSLNEHQIQKTERRGDEPFMWLVGAPGSCFYQATVVVSYDGAVIVHGDIDIVCFQAYRGPGGPVGAVRWVALSGLDYLQEKASIGTGREVAHDYCEEVALDDVLWQIKELKEQVDEEAVDGEIEKQIAGWRDVEQAIRDGKHEHYVREIAYEELGDPEIPSSIGDVPSARVIWAWMIVCKLHKLIEAQA